MPINIEETKKKKKCNSQYPLHRYSGTLRRGVLIRKEKGKLICPV